MSDDKIPVRIEFEIPADPERLARLLETTTEQATAGRVTVHFTLQEEGQLELPGINKFELSKIVPVAYFHWFYKNRFKDNTSSTLPTQTVTKVAQLLPDKEITTDNKNNPLGFGRVALDALASEVRSVRGSGLAGPKTRRYFLGVMDSLPPHPTEE